MTKEKLLERQKFFTLWYDRCQAICDIQLRAVQKELDKIK